MIKNPGPFLAAGARLPSGLLMVGPPGTGKTLMARVMASEAGVPVRFFFFLTTIKAAKFMHILMYVGHSPRVETLVGSFCFSREFTTTVYSGKKEEKPLIFFARVWYVAIRLVFILRPQIAP